MALGDGIRRNVAHVSAGERKRLRDAILKLDSARFYPDGVSYWDKQDAIHQATHVHDGPAFLPWHRELCNRFEALIRGVDHELSLHYWDWTTDPRASPDGTGGTVNLFTVDFMGSAAGPVGPPLDVLGSITRNVNNGTPGAPGVPADSVLLATGDTAPDANQYNVFRRKLEGEHGSPSEPGTNVHGYIGGTIGFPHTAFEDPFVFLLHSNVDRLWAMWQTAAGKAWRLAPTTTYGFEAPTTAITEDMQPWAGGSGLVPWTPATAPDVVKKNSLHASVVAPPCYDTLPSSIHLVTVVNPGSVINFNDVPEGETAARAAVFEVYGCGNATFEVKPGSGPAAPYSVLTPGGSVTVPPGPSPFRARVWLGFTGTTAGTSAPPGSVILRCVQTGQEFTFTLTANTISRPTVAVVLSLDQSGSMDEPAGTSGRTRIEALRESASQFVELAQADNGVGIVRFDHNAYAGLPVMKLGASIFDPNRVTVRDAVAAHATNPAGWTSIGDGVALARSTLTPITGYAHKAIVVFTDGLENQPAYIADVMGQIDNRTFAIGLGSPEQVSTAALTALTNGTGGYLLVTGALSASIDDYFRLSKYFLQVLAGVTNTNVVVDPIGFIGPGAKVRVPFVLNEADIDTSVILLGDLPVVHLSVETPDGDLIDPGNAAGIGGAFEVGTRMAYYRLVLPVPLGAGAHAGIWHAVLEVDKREFKKALSRLDDRPEELARARAHGVLYSLNVHASSNLRLEARLVQSGLQPGATFWLRARLTEYGIPVEHRGTVVARGTRPDGSETTIALSELEPGIFEARTVATASGLYRFRVLASGWTMRGRTFTREQELSGAVFQGGDRPLPTTSGDPRVQDERLCRLLTCLLNDKNVGRYLEERDVDVKALKRCVDVFCRRGGRPV